VPTPKACGSGPWIKAEGVEPMDGAEVQGHAKPRQNIEMFWYEGEGMWTCAAAARKDNDDKRDRSRGINSDWILGGVLGGWGDGGAFLWFFFFVGVCGGGLNHRHQPPTRSRSWGSSQRESRVAPTRPTD